MKHILFTLKGCNTVLLDDEAHIRQVLIAAAHLSQSEMLELCSYKFQPQGVTAIAMLAESHISIHTWPETGAAVCDVFTCGEHTSPESAVRYMYDHLQASDIVEKSFLRSKE